MKNLLARLLGIGQILWTLLTPILAGTAARTLEALAPIAIQVVSDLATSGGSGAAKREAAVRKIQTLAIAQGIAAAESAIRLAIELAVTRLKAS